ncbi:MAG TPA: HAD-IA family hydrolase [Dissulfurispiraceae bacterium]|nr:HAD-IA family hydrolase [Dissulfurispiraceae bacterium]
MSVRLILFDLDGTLVDSRRDITNAVNHALAPVGIGPATVEEITALVGEGISRLMEKLAEREKVTIDTDGAVERFLRFYAAHLVDFTTVYPDVTETLHRLDGYRKAVISNKREVLTAGVLREFGLTGFFDVIVGSDTTPERKPSPRPLMYVVEKFGLSAGEAVMVGDSTYDIQAGRAAGVKTVAVTYGYRPRHMLGDADVLIDRFAELPDVIATLDGGNRIGKKHEGGHDIFVR